MKYEKASIEFADDAQEAVRGNKGHSNIFDGLPPFIVQTALAYEADE